MPTKAQLQVQLDSTKEELTIAQSNSLEDATARDLSRALLNKIDLLCDEASDRKDEAEKQYDALKSAYDEADSVDDIIIDLGLDD